MARRRETGAGARGTSPTRTPHAPHRHHNDAPLSTPACEWDGRTRDPCRAAGRGPAAARAAADAEGRRRGGGRRSPTPRGGAPAFGWRTGGGPGCPTRGQSRRAAAAPTRPPAQGPGPGRGRAPNPTGGRAGAGGEGAGDRHPPRHPTTAQRRRMPSGTPTHTPGTGDRDRGTGPRPGPHPPNPGRQGGRHGRGRPFSHDGWPGETTGARSGARTRRTGPATRGLDTPLPPDVNTQDASGKGRNGTVKRGTHLGRTDTERNSGLGRRRDPRARPRPPGKAQVMQRAGRGDGRPPWASGEKPQAQTTAARTHTHGVSPPVASEHKGGPARHLERPPGLQRSPRTSRGPGAPPTTATAVAASAPEPSSHTHAAGRPSHSDVYQTHAGPPTGPRSKGTHQGDADAGRRWPGATPQRWSRLGTQMGLPQRTLQAKRSACDFPNRILIFCNWSVFFSPPGL